MHQNPKTCCQDLPCGESIPVHTPHAVSVSLPTISDVINYKENKEGWRNRMKNGYPRFFTHKFELIAIDYIRKVKGISTDQQIILSPSADSVNKLFSFFNISFPVDYLYDIFYFTVPDAYVGIQDIRLYMQRSGSKVFSRQLEDFLAEIGLLKGRYVEDIVVNEAEDAIKKTLSQLYNTDAENVRIYASGMTSVFAAFQSLQQLGKANERSLFLQFGEIYFDTMDIVQSYSKNSIVVQSVYDFVWLENILEVKGSQIAGIFTEIPTNPFMAIPDLPRLYKLAQKYNIPLVVDSTLGTPVNYKILPYCDIVVESLTKFAAGTCDVMGGAAIVNPESAHFNQIGSIIGDYGVSMYKRDAQRLAYTIKGYNLRVSWSRNSIPALVTYLENHPRVKKVHWSHSKQNRELVTKVELQENSYSLVVTVEFDEPIQPIYDKLKLPKGPSLGTDFTLVMPYIYLAHYDLMKTSRGRSLLKARGVNPEIIRISLGCEPVEQIIGAFAEALSY